MFWTRSQALETQRTALWSAFTTPFAAPFAHLTRLSTLGSMTQFWGRTYNVFTILAQEGFTFIGDSRRKGANKCRTAHFQVVCAVRGIQGGGRVNFYYYDRTMNTIRRGLTPGLCGLGTRIRTLCEMLRNVLCRMTVCFQGHTVWRTNIFISVKLYKESGFDVQHGLTKNPIAQ